MWHLLKLEWLKVKNYRAFWIFLALYIIGLFSINWIAYHIQSEIKKNKVPLKIFPLRFSCCLPNHCLGKQLVVVLSWYAGDTCNNE